MPRCARSCAETMARLSRNAERMAKESGIETPTAEDLVRLDRQRKGKRLSNEEWTSPTDPEAKIAKMKDGRTHLAYKPEHAVDLDTGAIVAAEIHPADQGDTTTLPETLEAAADQPGGGRRRADAGGPGRAGRRQRLSLARRPEGPGRRGLEEPHRREEGAGRQPLARRRRGPAGGLQQPHPACARGWPRKRSSCGPSWSSAASPSPSIVAACVAPGCAAARTCTSATWCTSPATISA